MLKTRLLTAIVALSVLLFVLNNQNTQLMRALFAVFVGLGTFELGAMLLPAIYSRFSCGQNPALKRWNSILVLMAVCIFGGYTHSEASAAAYIVVGLLSALLLGIFLVPKVELAFGHTSVLILCLVYGCFPWLAIWELYSLSGGKAHNLYLLCSIVWCGDTGAYFAGRKFGSHKLAPRMSPNKTWEGALGGLVASIAGGVIVKFIFIDQLPNWGLILLCSVLGAIFGQMGDLVESTFKRFSGVKDSGTIFPGHGGFLDRVDGLLFAAPVIWIILA